MAQTAKIISPDKKVLLPNVKAGCLMADMINHEQMIEFKQKHPNLPVVCYINSTAEVKAECDICCTSSNALEIVKSLNAPQVLFVPDANLGKWVEGQLEGVEVIVYDGNCPVHNNITVEDIELARKNYPNAKILIHPECKPKVSHLGDYVGSTSGIINYVKNSEHNQFVIVTEKGVVDRLRRDYPEKTIIPIKNSLICPNMKMTSLEDIKEVLTNETNEIFVKEDIAKKAVRCIDRMMEASK